MLISSPRKMAKLSLAAACAMIGGSVSTLSAISVTTDPVGFITITAKPINTTAPANNPTGLTYISLGMARPVAYQSNIPTTATVAPAGNGTSITFASNVFTVGQFGAASSHYLEILTGSSAGFTTDVTATSLNSLTVADNIAAAIANDGTTTFRLRPYWTLAAAFGANTPGFQTGNGSSANADLIQTVNPSTGVVTSFYYNSASPGWKYASDNSDANGVTIPPDAGLQIVRPNSTGAGDLAFKLTGDVKTGKSGLRIDPSANNPNLVANPYPIESVLLKDSGLQNSIAGGTSTTGDTVRILDFSRNVFNDYFFETSTSKWKCGFTDASLAVIPMGSSAAIIRKTGVAQTTNWFAPQPGMVLGDVPLPLTLVSAVSRKFHGVFNAGDINLPLSGAVGVENRFSGASLDYSIVFTFSGASLSNPISAVNAQFNPGLLSDGTTLGSGSIVGSPIISGNTITVNLTNVTNAQTASISLSNIATAGGQTLASANANFGILQGDINGNRTVTSTDISIVKSQSLAPITMANFRLDAVVIGSGAGAITSSDISFVKTKSLTSLP